jgi:hypothetical protein
MCNACFFSSSFVHRTNNIAGQGRLETEFLQRIVANRDQIEYLGLREPIMVCVFGALFISKTSCPVLTAFALTRCGTPEQRKLS